jgi:two-component system nitrate/nitrite response regulator NarL
MADQDESRASVVVVDDHELFLTGLIRMLADHVDVLGSARTGEEALQVVADTRPDVVLMDLNLPGMTGAEAIRRLRDEHASLCVVVLTVMEDERALVEAIQAGAAGYLLKNASIEDIVDGIRAATTGGSLVAPELMGKLLRSLRSRPQAPARPRAPLTRREREVLELMVEGYDNAEIARRLVISQNTVKNHVAAILSKLGVQNRIQAAVLAARGGM